MFRFVVGLRLRSLRIGAPNQVIVVDVHHFGAFVVMSERNRPERGNPFLEVDRALVVTLVQSGRTGQRIESAIPEAIDDRLDHNPDVVQLRFRQTRHAAPDFIGQRSHHFIIRRRIHAEQRSIFPFDRIENRRTSIPFFVDVRIFNQLTPVRTDRNDRRRSPEFGEHD